MAKDKKLKAKDEAAEARDEKTTAKADENKKKEPQRKRKEKKEKRPLNPDAPLHQIMPILLTALAALFGVCIYTQIEMV